MTRFTKEQLYRLLLSFDLPIKITTEEGYTMHREEAILYLLRRFSRGVTHATMEDDIHGGHNGQNISGYKWLAHYLDGRYYELIGPRGLELWGQQFASFAEQIRQKIAMYKLWYDGATGTYEAEPGVYFEEGNFKNVIGFTDCKDWKVCRPGAGPNKSPYPHIGASRRPNWYTKQRAFYGGHHKHHAMKTLAFCLPNGMTAAVFGRCSARRHDNRILNWSGIDQILFNFQTQFLGLGPNKLYKFYGDSAYLGPWRGCIVRAWTKQCQWSSQQSPEERKPCDEKST
jgi:hypothetical protein